MARHEIKTVAPGDRVAFGAAAIALAASVFVVAVLVYLSGRPIDTNDAWFHLAVGRVYLEEGPWPNGDPLLHTARSDAPIQHEWLFSAGLALGERAFGFTGLRVGHAASVVGILGLVGAVFLRAVRFENPRSRRAAIIAAAPSFLALAVFVQLSWWRLFQLRPDLASVAATLLLYLLVLERRNAPGFGRVVASAVLIGVWANLHSLFAVGLALLLAALLGLALEAALEIARGAPVDRRTRATLRARAVRIGAALGLGTLVSLVNPRGFEQHLTFFTSSREAAIWAVTDEWQHFDPFSPFGYAAQSLSFASWLCTNALLVAFSVCAVLTVRRTLRRRDRTDGFDGVHLALGAAAFVAIFVSVRFVWLSVFPLVFVLRVWRSFAPREPIGALASAVGCVAIALAFPASGGLDRDATRADAYLDRPFSTAGLPSASTRFLLETRVSGSLYNEYLAGGYLGYWLSPAVRTFIDGRTEHYSAEVARDYGRLHAGRGRGDGGGFRELLDQYRIDWFIGRGLPRAEGIDAPADTTRRLAGAGGWRLVFRSVNEAIYMRVAPRNAENLRRVEAYYAARSIPFDPKRGFDPAAAIRANPDWSISNRLLPSDYRELRRASGSDVLEERVDALDRLAWAHLLAGDTAGSVRFDRALGLLGSRRREAARRLAASRAPRGDAQHLELLTRRDVARLVRGRYVEVSPASLQRARNAATAPAEGSG